jgi:hypothetical protein
VNDLRESVLKGGATDYGQTASFMLQYSTINNDRLTQIGLGLDLFTPQPDFSKAPSNPQNSDEGRHRVWYTSAPWENLFAGNLFVEVTHQSAERAISAKLGADSHRLGAFLQNSIHDEFGVLPRFPWAVEQSEKAFFEITATQQVH